MKKVITFLADGFETVEALTTVDVLRRAGIEVTTVSVMPILNVTSAQGIIVQSDKMLEDADIESADMLFLPGGGGYKLLLSNDIVTNAVDSFAKAGKKLAAICAAPSILGRMGLLEGRNATCFPGFEQYMFNANVTGGAVEVADNIITGKGMGVSLEFALKVLEVLTDEKTAEDMRKNIQAR